VRETGIADMQIELRYDPIPLILGRGRPIDVLELLDEAGLLFTTLAQGHLLALLSQQRRDGGFPSAFDGVHFGVRETERVVRLLLHAGLGPETLNVNAALDLLLDIQRPDGGWSENPALPLPPSEATLSTRLGVTWLTAEVALTLEEADRDTEEAYWHALEWLHGWQCQGGGWPLLEGMDQPHPDSSTLITFFLADIYSEADPVVNQGKAYYERCLTEISRDAQQRYREVRGERRGLDIYHLVDTVLEPQAAAAGYTCLDQRIVRIVEAVADIQRRDGGWRPFWREESDPAYTAYALRALVWVEALEREQLAEMIRRHLR
jgi:hypothetical protein